MLFLCTDFGYEGPYIGQMKAVSAIESPNCRVIDLMHDLPKYNPRSASYLVATLINQLPPACIVVSVVDPGVGSDRSAIAIYADQRWLVGPDNGLLDVAAMRARSVSYHQIVYQPEKMSASFHGRDLFMPVAMRIINQLQLDEILIPVATPDFDQLQTELAEIIYVDGFGNLMTGLMANLHKQCEKLIFKNRQILRVKTFSEATEGQAFFYENSQGLLEIAVNKGNAQQYFAAQIGDPVFF